MRILIAIFVLNRHCFSPIGHFYTPNSNNPGDRSQG